MKCASIDLFEKLDGQLESIYQEMSALARKSPNDAVNAFKIGLVNSTLKQCNALFGKKYLPFEDFSEFSQDELPSNSDVAFIVSQYRGCAEKLRADNIEQVSFKMWAWKVEDGGERIPTAPPKKIS
jgi:hypothetical protein